MSLVHWPKPKAAAAKAGESRKHCTCFHCLVKLMRKIKKESQKMIMARMRRTRQRRSVQCRYDPLSYSLNFDAGGGGASFGEDYHYHHHHWAFSARFVAAAGVTPQAIVTTEPASNEKMR